MTTTANDQRIEQDLVAVLLDAHARGREILDTALQMLRSADAEDDVAARIAANVHRFLTFTNLQHEMDEEQLVFPALRANALRASGPHDEVDAALTQVIDTHVLFDARRDELAARWERVARAPACLRGERAELLAATGKLASALARHQRHEELAIFPLVQKYVPAETQAKILAVMSRREARS